MGAPTSFFDLHILDNDHVVLISHDLRQVDMSQVVEGGNPEATVIGAVIQELDADRNVVFEWQSWDHFEITDAVHEDLTAPLVRYVHVNFIDVDPNGDFILSCRFLNEVTKISRETGEILWRLGGNNNQFTFVNDPEGGVQLPACGPAAAQRELDHVRQRQLPFAPILQGGGV